MNAHIAIICVPMATVLNPVLPIVSALMRRGHRVTFATSGPFESRIAELGVEVIRYRYGVMTARGQDEYSYCRLAINAIAAIKSFYGQEQPDLIIYDIASFAGPILAHKWQVPRIRVSPLCALRRDSLERQLITPKQCALAIEFNARIDEFLRENGTPSTNYLFHRERLNIHTMPRDFDPCASLADKRCLYAGRCAGEQFPFGHWRRPDRKDKPTVLVAASKTHAPTFDYFKLCIAALTGLPWHVVLSIDDDATASELQPLPGTFEIVQKTSHTRILPHASLMVFMGGAASSNEAAYHGVPLVMISLGVDELEAWAENLVRLGLGVHLKGQDVSASLIRRTALETIESPSVLRNVRQLQRRVRREPGAEEAANHIEEILDADAAQ